MPEESERPVDGGAVEAVPVRGKCCPRRWRSDFAKKRKKKKVERQPKEQVVMKLEAAGASVLQAYPLWKSVPSGLWPLRRWAHEEDGQGRGVRA